MNDKLKEIEILATLLDTLYKRLNYMEIIWK